MPAGKPEDLLARDLPWPTLSRETQASPVTQAMSLPQMVDPVRARESLAQLQNILRRSAIPAANTIEALDQLVDHVGEGYELFNIPGTAVTDILYQAAVARLQAGAAGGRTQRYLDRLSHLNVEPGQQTILNAWRSFNQGAINEAMAQLSAEGTPDAREQILQMYLRQHDRVGIINWFLKEAPKGIENLSAASWHTVAATFAKSELWEEAAGLLAQMQPQHYAACPHLYYLEGIINLALLLPPVHRKKILYRQLFGIRHLLSQHPAARHYRERAHWALQQATQSLSAIGAPDRAEKALRMSTWLLLTDPATYEQGVAAVQDAMHEPTRAALYIELAAEFTIAVHTRVLQRYLNKQALIAGFDADEIAARYFYLKYIGNHVQLIQFLSYEQDKLQRRVFDAGTWADFLIHELLATDRFPRAEAIMYSHRETLTEDFPKWSHNIAHLRCNLATPFQKFIDDESVTNLSALCRHLQAAGDAAALKPFVQELFQRQPTLEHAVAVAQCLVTTRDDLLLLTFLEQNLGLMEDDAYLTQCYAWCQFQQGNVQVVSRLLDQTAQPASDGQILSLALYNAFTACDWRQLAPLTDKLGTVDATWQADDLLTLALIVAPMDKQHAVALITQAVNIAGDKPRLLTQAYNLMVNLGEKISATPWLYRAICAYDNTGALWQHGYNQIVDIVSNARECPSNLWTHVSAAHFPAALAAQALHYPLSELLVGQALANEQDGDARYRTLIPLHLAHCGANDISMARSVAMDFGALLLAESLQLWPLLTRRFDTIVIPFSTAGVLREEQLKLQHGQLPRFEIASHLLAHVEQGRIDILLPISTHPPAWLVNEVGVTRAQLLHAAHTNRGKVILPTPIFKSYSMACEEAELGIYDECIVSTHQCLDVLVRNLSAAHRTTAKSYLSDMDTDHIHTMAKQHDGPIYLDEQALVYLSDARVLDEALNSGHHYCIHSSTVQELHDTLTAASYREDTMRVLESLQQRLQQGIAAGNIRLTPRLKSKYNVHTLAGSIVELLDGYSYADFYWIDDRSLSSRKNHLNSEDRRQKRLIGLLDIIDELADSGLLSKQEKFALRLNLRRRGYYAIPLELPELHFWLAESRMDSTGKRLMETDALRDLRHYTQQIMANQVLQLPAEAYFMDRLHLTVMVAVRDTWAQSENSLALAEARSTWLADELFPKLTQWRHALEPAMNLYFFEDTSAMSIAAFLALQPADPRRAAAYLRWLGQSQLTPLETRNWPVIEKTAAMHAQQLVTVVSAEKASGTTVTPALLGAYIDMLPPLLHPMLNRDADLGRLTGSISDSKASDLIFAEQRAVLLARLTSNINDLTQLVPTDMGYYEALCGTTHDYYEIADYLNRVWEPHLQQLLATDLVAGLTIALPTGVFNCTRIRHALNDIDNDTLWNALAVAREARDPITLLNLLDLSLCRSADARYHDLAEHLIARLHQQRLLHADRHDLYVVFPKLLAYLYQRLRHLPRLSELPEYWLRLCAWSHCGMLINDCCRLQVDFGPLLVLLDAEATVPREITDLVQVLATPGARMMLPSQCDFPLVMENLMQRMLTGLLEAQAIPDHSAPLRQNLELLLAPRAEQRRPWFRDIHDLDMPDDVMPNTRPALMPAVVQDLKSKVDSDPRNPLWKHLGLVAQTWTLPPDLLATVAAALPLMTLAKDPEQRHMQLAALGDLAYLPCICRHQDLGSAFLMLCMRTIRLYGITQSEVRLYFTNGMLASSHGENLQENFRQFNLYLRHLLSEITEHESLQTLQMLIRSVKQETSVNIWGFSQSEALLGMAL